MLSSLGTIRPKGSSSQRLWVQKYLGSNKPVRGIKTNEIVNIAKTTISTTPPDQLLKLVDRLYSKGTLFEEIQLAGCILNRNPLLKTQAGIDKLDNWLDFTVGWAETDILCQNGWDTNAILANWSKWKKLLTKFAKNPNIHKRRASLVLLVTPVRKSPDKRLAKIAFQNIGALKREREILITKAISWLLRALILHHKKEVQDYLLKNKDTLPKIAVREVTNKLKTGKK